MIRLVEDWHGYTRRGKKAHRVYYPRPGMHALIYCTNHRVHRFVKDAEPGPRCGRCFD